MQKDSLEIALIKYNKKTWCKSALLGLFIGFLFEMTQSLWLTTICHAVYNWILMWLIKTDRVEYRASNP